MATARAEPTVLIKHHDGRTFRLALSAARWPDKPVYTPPAREPKAAPRSRAKLAYDGEVFDAIP